MAHVVIDTSVYPAIPHAKIQSEIGGIGCLPFQVLIPELIRNFTRNVLSAWVIINGIRTQCLEGLIWTDCGVTRNSPARSYFHIVQPGCVFEEGLLTNSPRHGR